MPFCLDQHAIARDARFVVNDGDSLANDAIEEGRLSHIGASDNGNDLRHDRTMRDVRAA